MPKYSFIGFLELICLEFKRQTTLSLFESNVQKLKPIITPIELAMKNLVNPEIFNKQSILSLSELSRCD
jgi:hypothetical protein